MLTTPRTYLALATSGALVSLALTGCGGSVKSLASTSLKHPSNPSLTQEQTFSGNLGQTNHAAVRWISLKAGDALKGFIEPQQKHTAIFAIGIAIRQPVFSAWQADQSFYSDSSSFFSDTPYFFSDTPAPPGTAGMVILHRSSWYPPGDIFGQNFSTSPPRFFVSGRPWDGEPAGGTWFMLVAPATASYGLLIADDTQPFTVTLQTHPRPSVQSSTSSSTNQFDTSSAGPGPFPYTGTEWASVVRSQMPWLFAHGFFPTNSFVGRTLSPHNYGPTPALQHQIASALG